MFTPKMQFLDWNFDFSKMLDGANEIILMILNIPEDLKKIARFARILVEYINES